MKKTIILVLILALIVFQGLASMAQTDYVPDPQACTKDSNCPQGSYCVVGTCELTCPGKMIPNTELNGLSPTDYCSRFKNCSFVGSAKGQGGPPQFACGSTAAVTQ